MIRGRYVAVALEGQNTLTVCEMRVYGAGQQLYLFILDICLSPNIQIFLKLLTVTSMIIKLMSIIVGTMTRKTLMSRFPSESTPTTLFPDSFNLMSAQGADCNTACNENGLVCNPHIVTNDDSKVMNNAGVSFCFRYSSSNKWFANDQPGFVAGSADPNRNRCIGFQDVPDQVKCDGKYWSVQRLCTCDNSG